MESNKRGREEDILDWMKKEMETERFKLSSELIGLKINGLGKSKRGGWTFGEMADMAGMSREEYLKYEYGDIGLSVEDFKRVINKVKGNMKDIEDQSEEDL